MKVLILSHNPITDYNSMGKTFLGLFGEFNTSELSQLYVYPTKPNIKKCSSYFRITDIDALKSAIFFINPGKEIFFENNDSNLPVFNKSALNHLLYKKKGKNTFKILVRSIIWGVSHWYSKKLEQWLNKQNVDILFVAPGASPFFYNMAMQIKKKLNIPMVSYICDDFYLSVDGTHSMVDKIYAKILKKKIRALISESKLVYTICDSLATTYRSMFGCETLTLSTASNIPIADSAIENSSYVISYLGSLQLNRFKSLLDIGLALDTINQECNSYFELHIYSGETDKNIINYLSQAKSIRYMGFIKGDEVHKVMTGSLMVLHVESFNQADINRVKYSVSTKIADSLSSGVCLFAYGSSAVASIQHLVSNRCAQVAVSHSELKGKLKDCLFNKNIRDAIVSRALQVAKKFHEKNIQSQLLYKSLKEILRHENNTN